MKRLEAGHWFSMNGMITNPDKYQAMILGNATIPLVNDTNIWVKDNIELPGVNIDKNLQFNNHVKNICTKVNNQINVISRFRKIVPTEMKCKLYKAFIVSHFRYCSAVWHSGLFWMRRMRSLCTTRSYWASLILVIRIVSGAKTWRKQFMRQFSLKWYRSTYIHGLFQMWNTERNLRGSKKLVIAYVNTTTYGLHSLI